MSLFRSSPVQTLIEKATGELLIGPDWTLNMEICEMVNTQPDAPKDAVKYIRKRMKNKNPKVALLSLNVLDALMKNCDQRLHREVGNKDTLSDLKKLAGDKKGVDRVSDKVLELIQTWGEGFRSRRDVSLFSSAYDAMKTEGVTFPPPSGESFVPMVTPEAVIGAHNSFMAAPAPAPAARAPAPASAPGEGRRPTTGEGRRPAAPGTSPPKSQSRSSSRPSGGQSGHTHRAEDPRLQLERDIEMIRNNANLLSEMLAYVKPGEDISQNDLLQELLKNCRDTQPRLMAMIGNVDSEALVSVMLEVNDELNRAFVTYERLVTGDTSIHSDRPDDSIDLTVRSPAPAPAPAAPVPSRPPAASPLIDMGLFPTAAPVWNAPQPAPAAVPRAPAAAPASPQPQGPVVVAPVASPGGALPTVAISPLAPPPRGRARVGTGGSGVPGSPATPAPGGSQPYLYEVSAPASSPAPAPRPIAVPSPAPAPAPAPIAGDRSLLDLMLNDPPFASSGQIPLTMAPPLNPPRSSSGPASPGLAHLVSQDDTSAVVDDFDSFLNARMQPAGAAAGL